MERTIEVSGCNGCVFLRPYDMSLGGVCEIEPKLEVKEDEDHFSFQTPKKCPLKKGPVKIKMVKSVK